MKAAQLFALAAMHGDLVSGPSFGGIRSMHVGSGQVRAFDASHGKPHVGEREKARRRRQIERARAKDNEGWNHCPRCKAIVNVDDVCDGSEVYCYGCELLLCVVAFQGGIWRVCEYPPPDACERCSRPLHDCEEDEDCVGVEPMTEEEALAFVRAGSPPDIRRASGDAVCEDCGKTFLRHPLDPNEVGFAGPFLNRLCSGSS